MQSKILLLLFFVIASCVLTNIVYATPQPAPYTVIFSNHLTEGSHAVPVSLTVLVWGASGDVACNGRACPSFMHLEPNQQFSLTVKPSQGAYGHVQILFTGQYSDQGFDCSFNISDALMATGPQTIAMIPVISIGHIKGSMRTDNLLITQDGGTSCHG